MLLLVDQIRLLLLLDRLGLLRRELLVGLRLLEPLVLLLLLEKHLLLLLELLLLELELMLLLELLLSLQIEESLLLLDLLFLENEVLDVLVVGLRIIFFVVSLDEVELEDLVPAYSTLVVLREHHSQEFFDGIADDEFLVGVVGREGQWSSLHHVEKFYGTTSHIWKCAVEHLVEENPGGVDVSLGGEFFTLDDLWTCEKGGTERSEGLDFFVLVFEEAGESEICDLRAALEKQDVVGFDISVNDSETGEAPEAFYDIAEQLE